MAVSSAVTAVDNIDNSVINDDAILTKGRVYAIPFTYEKLATNTNGDHIQIARVHSDWSVKSIKLWNDALTGATAVDIGLYDDEAPASATAADDDAYASAVDISAGVSGTEYAFEARGIDKMGQKVWQDDTSISARPAGGAWYRIALTLDTGGTATGTISGVIEVITPS